MKNLTLIPDRLGQGRHAFKIDALSWVLGGRKSIDAASNYPSYGDYYDCRDWAFDNIGLPQYTWREGRDTSNRLLMLDFPTIGLISQPEEGSVVAYFRNTSHVPHWGVVTSVGKTIEVHSKWGALDVFSHPLERAKSYGDYVCFFKKKKL
jgi:hypothetical protein